MWGGVELRRGVDKLGALGCSGGAKGIGDGLRGSDGLLDLKWTTQNSTDIALKICRQMNRQSEMKNNEIN